MNIKKLLRHTFVVLAIGCLVSCSDSKDASEQAKKTFTSVIPKPSSANLTSKTFFLGDETVIQAEGAAKQVADYLAQALEKSNGVKLAAGEAKSEKNFIRLALDGNNLGEEGYKLDITEENVVITASKPAGLFYGVQTLRQLLPVEGDRENGKIEIATGSIEDRPEYEWRGSMLDVARHFFSVEDVKRYIDLIAYYKMNRLHLHLSDDQGWRIEIKSWPNLTAIGGQSQVGGGKGGFYTQEQYKDIVAYAQRQFVTVVPEIDLPGHINAALASYPELNAGPPIVVEKGQKPRPIAGKPYTGIEVGFSTLHIKKDVTFKFVNDVIRELSEITPGPYIHIGGDEAAVTKKPDYIAFINRFKEIVKANGKQMIGWEEIAQGDIDSSVISQHWHSEQFAKDAAAKGAKIIFSPSKKVYLDMQYDSTSRLGLHWAAYIEVDSSYMWDPATRVAGIEREDILGVEAPLWSETIATMDDIEYLLFPRLPGVAEVGWTAAKDRDWNDYKVRLAAHAKQWEAMDIDYYKSPKVDWPK